MAELQVCEKLKEHFRSRAVLRKYLPKASNGDYASVAGNVTMLLEVLRSKECSIDLPEQGLLLHHNTRAMKGLTSEMLV